MGIKCFSPANRRSKNRQPKVEDNIISSADIVSHDDILSQILLKLQNKSLSWFKCVCKHWQYLLSTPRFILLQNPHTGLFIHRWRSSSITSPDYDFVPFDHKKPIKPHPLKTINFYHKTLEILQSCNGLMLCARIMRKEKFKSVVYDKYYVHNPTTNQFVTLPKLNTAKAFN